MSSCALLCSHLAWPPCHLPHACCLPACPPCRDEVCAECDRQLHRAVVPAAHHPPCVRFRGHHHHTPTHPPVLHRQGRRAQPGRQWWVGVDGRWAGLGGHLWASVGRAGWELHWGYRALSAAVGFLPCGHMNTRHRLECDSFKCVQGNPHMVPPHLPLHASSPLLPCAFHLSPLLQARA